MEEDEKSLRNPKPLDLVTREALDVMSVEELEVRIGVLKREISRVEEAIRAKNQVLGAAHNLFK